MKPKWWNGMDDNMVMSLITGYAIVAVWHICGLVLLYRIKFRPANQRTILLHLAFSELGVALTLTIVYLFLLPGKCNDDCYIADVFLFSFFAVGNKMVMLYLIFDRVIEIKLNIKYPLYFSNNCVKKILMTMWIFTGGYSLTLALLIKLYLTNQDQTSRKTVKRVMTSVLILQDIMIIFSALITYAILYKKVRNMIFKENSQMRVPESNRRMSNSKFLLPTLIVASYITFNLAGDIMFFYNLSMKTHDRLNPISRLFWIFGWLADGILYVFLQRSIRGRLLAPCRQRTYRASTYEMKNSNIVTSNISRVSQNLSDDVATIRSKQCP